MILMEFLLAPLCRQPSEEAHGTFRSAVISLNLLEQLKVVIHNTHTEVIMGPTAAGFSNTAFTMDG